MGDSQTTAAALADLDRLHAGARGDALVSPPDFGERIEACVATLEATGSEPSRLGRALLLLALHRAEGPGGRREGLELVERARELLAASDELDLLDAALLEGDLQVQLGDLDATAAAIDQARELLERQDEAPLRGIGLATLEGRLARRRGDKQAARRHFERARDLCVEAGARGRLMRVMLNLGVLHYGQWDYPLAIEYHENALRHVLEEPEPPRPFVGLLHFNLALIHLDAERFERAADYARRTQDWIAEAENLYMHLRARLCEARATLALGHEERARQVAAGLRLGAERWLDRDNAVHIAEELSELLWKLEEPRDLVELAGKALDRVGPDLAWAASPLRLRGWFLRGRLSCGERPAALREELNRLLETFEAQEDREVDDTPNQVLEAAIEIYEASGDHAAALAFQRHLNARFIESMRRMLGRGPSYHQRMDPRESRDRLVADLVGHMRQLEQAREDVEREAEERRTEARQRKAAEAQVEHLGRLEFVGRLAGSVAHDFNNLLTVILSNTSLVELGELTGDQRAALDAIRSAGEGGAALVRRLLAMGRPPVLEPQLVRVGAFLEEALPVVRSILAGGVLLDVQQGAAGAAVQGDPNQLQAVLVNLVLNAREVMAAGGRLVIRTELLEAAAARDTGLEDAGHGILCLAVADTGGGIPAEDRGRIFEPFFTTRAAEAGSGMGLTSARDIARRHGGDLRLASSSPRGTTFELLVPAASADLPVVEVPRPRVDLADLGDRRVLLVEDNEAVRDLAIRALETAGARVVGARDGRDALVIFRELDDARRPDLVITDMVMPHLGGGDLVEALRGEGYRGPVLFVSAYTELPPETGPDREFLSKPFRMQDLCARAALLLGERRSGRGPGRGSVPDSGRLRPGVGLRGQARLKRGCPAAEDLGRLPRDPPPTSPCNPSPRNTIPRPLRRPSTSDAAPSASTIERPSSCPWRPPSSRGRPRTSRASACSSSPKAACGCRSSWKAARSAAAAWSASSG